MQHPSRSAAPAGAVPELRVPVVVARGARVGIAALSGPVDLQLLAKGKRELESMGFAVEQAPNVALASGFLAGTDTERLDGFHRLLRSEVDGILFSRGGHGVLRIIDQIDWTLLSARPRWFVGYSDLTPLLLEVSKRTGWMTVHGPMVATDLARGLVQEERETLLTALSGRYDRRWQLLRATADGDDGAEGSNVLGLRDGIEGPLFGGCLAMVCAALGTAFDPSSLFEDAIVFLEDVGEAPYQIDRYMAQLGLAGLGRAQAVVFGHCRECRAQSDACAEHPESSDLLDEAVAPILADHSVRLGVPIFYGLPAGHGTPNLSLPLGANARIERDELRLSTLG